MMAARSTMTNLIQHLRTLTNAGTADYSAGTVSYWTDDQLQDVLDRNRDDIKLARLTAVGEQVSGSVIYLDYHIPEPLRWLEQGTTVTHILDENYGTLTAGTLTNNYAIDYNRHVITFVGNQEGDTRYLRGNSFDMNGAAADVWEQVAEFYAAQVDWASDNHSVKASQKHKHALTMKNKFRIKARGGAITRLVRGDEATWPG